MSRKNTTYQAHPTGLSEWESVVKEKLPKLSKTQAFMVAAWSFGIVCTQSSGVTTVGIFLAELLGVKEHTIIQRLKEWYKEKAAKKGEKRQEIDVTDHFVWLMKWVLSWWSSSEKRLALAMDASSLGQRFVILSISIVYRGCAIPVAWIVLKAGVKGEWRQEWEALFKHISGAIPSDWTVIVLADRGLYARWLFLAIQENGWHPFLRVNHSYGKFCQAGESQFLPLKMVLPKPGESWSGKVTCFKSNPLSCTLLACWDEKHSDPWLLLTDLEPEQADVFWYSLRFWIECGFKQAKRNGWKWHKTRMDDPARATRLWLAIAVATLWAVSVGSQAEDSLPPSSFDALPETHFARSFPPSALFTRHASCFRRGFLVILARLISHTASIPTGSFKPEPWPSRSGLEPAFNDST